MNQPFSELVAVVTGGASGIGAAVAARLRADGAKVAVFDLNPETAVADLAVKVNVGDTASVDAGVSEVAAKFGRIDVLVNNAGIGSQGDVAANSDEEWSNVFNINVFGIARVTRAALPYLRKSPHPAIVNTASVAGTTGIVQRAVYSSSKGAVISLTLAMAADHLHEGIRVNAVAPGTADTPWVGRLLDSSGDPEATRAALEARQPHGRLVTADEVADAVAYLASPRASSTNGVILAVDGGMRSLRVASN